MPKNRTVLRQRGRRSCSTVAVFSRSRWPRRPSQPRPDPKIVAAIDYDAYGRLKCKPQYALYGDDEPGAFPITFMHVGNYFPKTVRMYAVEAAAAGDSAREILYDPDYFAIPADSAAARLPADPSPLAGF